MAKATKKSGKKKRRAKKTGRSATIAKLSRQLERERAVRGRHDTWSCFEPRCPLQEHPNHYNFCPITGRDRKTASRRPPAGVPRSWMENPDGWEKFRLELIELTDEELACAGLIKRPGCVSGSGRTDAHGVYVCTNDEGKLVCAFCKEPIE
ncbi:MAG: hypothetical protein K0U16_07645 [Gammaproteobacteria bacterium]|nr:hypothetical protein [Gammaproteobacteria bacterium]